MTKKICVCTGKTCAERGAPHIMKELQKQCPTTTTCSCVGYCEQGPNVIIDDEYIIHDARIHTVAQKIEQNDYKKMEKITFEDVAHNDFLGDLF